MRRITKKDLNLTKLKTGCSPCLNEAMKMQQKLSNRKVSEIKIEDQLMPLELLKITKSIENKMGRTKVIDKGPRLIDIDIIFYENENFQSTQLVIPHPAWNQRSFVVFPLRELPFFKKSIFFDKIAHDFDKKFMDTCWIYQE